MVCFFLVARKSSTRFQQNSRSRENHQLQKFVTAFSVDPPGAISSFSLVLSQPLNFLPFLNLRITTGFYHLPYPSRSKAISVFWAELSHYSSMMYRDPCLRRVVVLSAHYQSFQTLFRCPTINPLLEGSNCISKSYKEILVRLLYIYLE